MNIKTLLQVVAIGCLPFQLSGAVEKDSFTKDDILKLADSYVHNKMGINNPAIVDVDGDGDFDILEFGAGCVAFYENIGSQETPSFVLKHTKFDSYSPAIMIVDGLPIPVFFADGDGDGDMDLFAVKQVGFNTATKANEYRILYAENHFDIDTGTLVTIILILVIVLLVLAILR